VSIAVVLKLNNQDVLTNTIAAQHTPGDPLYQKWLSKQQVMDNFAPTTAQAQAVAGYLTANGFTNVQIADNNLVVTADGTVGAARKAFNTQIGAFQRSDNGENDIANTSAIQTPDALSQIDYVLGLDTVNKAHTFAVRVAPQATVSTSAATCAKSGPPPLCTSTGNSSGYYPNEFATVYNRPSGSTGINTTVAIIGWGNMTNTVNDLAQFEASQGISPVPVSVQYLPVGSSTSDDSGQGEWAMDAQAIVGISGGVKQLNFYAATSNSNNSLISAINRAVSDGTAKAINMSWGAGECGGAGWADSLFQVGVAQGQTFAASSGDSGSVECNGVTSVSYPASSPYVIAIGGTSLRTGTNLAYQSETTWSGTGGGISAREAKPSWQSSFSGSYRQLPDLAFDADPASGVRIWLTSSRSAGISSTGWDGLWGGTSLASPLFVGAWAVLESANNNSLTFAPPLFYPNGSALQASGALHDVTSGNNRSSRYPNQTYYSAKAGYDNVTGWGSFDITKMMASMGGTTKTYTVTAGAGTGGTISPSGAVPVVSGTTQAFTLTPNSGYSISGVTGSCGGALSGSTYTTNAITANCTVTAAFSSTPPSPTPTYIITASAGTGGSISPSGYLSVASGQTQTFTLTPNSGYSIAGVSGSCGGTLSGNTYTTKAVTANCTVGASFAKGSTNTTPTYTVTLTRITPSGSSSPAVGTPVSVSKNGSTTFVLTPPSNARSASWTWSGGCGNIAMASTWYVGGTLQLKVGPVTSSCTFPVTFTVSR